MKATLRAQPATSATASPGKPTSRGWEATSSAIVVVTGPDPAQRAPTGRHHRCP